MKSFHGDSSDVAPLPIISVDLVFTAVTKDTQRIRKDQYRHFKPNAYFVYYFLKTSHLTEETKQCVTRISAHSGPRYNSYLYNVTWLCNLPNIFNSTEKLNFG